MTWTLCTSGAAIIKAGVGANADIVVSGAYLDNWSDEAESLACALARSDIVTNFGNLTATGKQVAQMFCSSYIAQKIVGYDVSGYRNSREAETILDMCETDITRASAILKEDKNKTYLGIT